MLVEWVVHSRVVDDVPFLQLADVDGIRVVVGMTVDEPVDSAQQAHPTA